MTLKELLGRVAPTLGGLVGGPLGLAAGQALSAILGVADPGDEAAMAKALQNADPATLERIKKADQDFRLELARLESAERASKAQADTARDTAQVELLKIDAGQGGFQAGWRPLVGYVCAAALCYRFLVHPTLLWAAQVHGGITPPVLPESGLFELIFGMLGLSGMRTYEKTRNA